MTYIQLSLLGIKAICKVKNSLSQEEFSVWYTPFYIYFPPSTPDKKQNIENLVESVKEKQEELIKFEQIVLF